MSNRQANDPLHGQTLEMIVNALVERYGWSELGNRINIRCFVNDPSVKSSLKFLRNTSRAPIPCGTHKAPVGTRPSSCLSNEAVRRVLSIDMDREKECDELGGGDGKIHAVVTQPQGQRE
jgi:hypothetical protein